MGLILVILSILSFTNLEYRLYYYIIEASEATTVTE